MKSISVFLIAPLFGLGNHQSFSPMGNKKEWTREDTLRLSQKLAKKKDFVSETKEASPGLFSRVSGDLMGTKQADGNFFKALTGLIVRLASRISEPAEQ